MSEWKEYKLGEICSYGKERIGVFSLTRATYISTENMQPNRGGVALASSIPDAGCVVAYKKDDVLVSNIRPYFKKIWLASHDGGCSADVLVFRNRENVDARFLYYLLSADSFFDYSMATAKGTKMPRGDKNSLMEYGVKLPHLAEQRRIAEILGALDDKIELNSAINRNLEEQAQALFKNWFIDFEPFGGVMPGDWKEVSLKDCCTSITDGVHNTVIDDPDGDCLLLSCKNIKGGVLSIGSDERKINCDTFEKLRKRTKLAKGDILLSSVGTVGELLLLNEEPGNIEFQRSVAIIKANCATISPVFLYNSLIAQKEIIVNAAHGAVQQCLFLSDINDIKTIMPTSDYMEKYTATVSPYYEQISTNQAENQRLATLRDTLLSKLMSDKSAKLAV